MPLGHPQMLTQQHSCKDPEDLGEDPEYIVEKSSGPRVRKAMTNRRSQTDPSKTLPRSRKIVKMDLTVGDLLKRRIVSLCRDTAVPQRHLVKAVLAATLDNYEGMLRSRLSGCKTKKEVAEVVKECFNIPLVKLM